MIPLLKPYRLPPPIRRRPILTGIVFTAIALAVGALTLASLA